MSLRRFSRQIEVGCDEAGRGSLSGPVVAAAVILPADFINDELNDSKKLTHAKRDKLNNTLIRIRQQY